MSPVKPGSPSSAVIVWRLLIVLAVLLASAALGLGAKLLAGADERLTENREVICSIGSFLTSSPIIRVEGTSRREFIGQLVTTRRFLADLRGIDCTDLDVGRPATTEEIISQLRRLRDQIREARGLDPRRPRGGVDAPPSDTSGRAAPAGQPGGTPAADSGDGGTRGGGDSGPAPGGPSEPPEPPPNGGGPQPGPGPGGGAEPPPASSPPTLGQGVGQVIEGAGGIVKGACTTVGAVVGSGSCP